MDRRHPPDQANNNLAEKLCAMANEMVAESLEATWLRGAAKPRVQLIPSEQIGQTGAIILRGTVEFPLHVKLHHKDAGREVAGYTVLGNGPDEFTRHLVGPLPTTGTDQPLLWLTPRVEADELHELTSAPSVSSQQQRWTHSVYANILASLKALWLHTRTPLESSEEVLHIYEERIGNRLEVLEGALGLPDFYDVRLDVDEHGDDGATLRSYGAFTDVMQHFDDMAGNLSVPYTCTTHGDEHAKNILIYKDAARKHNPRGWVIIDYAGARSRSDWIFSIAKMLQWWQFYCVLELAKHNVTLRDSLRTRMEKKDGSLILGYDRSALMQAVPPLCHELRHDVLAFAERVANDFGEDSASWRARLQLAYFSVVFASAPLHLKDNAFAVPVMIGESLRALYDANELC